MPATIIYDPEARVAVLVDVELPAALGPIAVADEGDDARLVLQEFVEHLDLDPATLPSWALFHEWWSYVNALTEMAQRVVDEADAADSAPPVGPDGESSPETPPGPTPPDESSEDGSGLAEEPDNGDEPSDLETEADLARIHDAPGTPAKLGEEECWMCHGELQIESPEGNVECPVCHGSGKTPAATPAP